MKTVKLLATLAILAGGAANAVTVNFDTATGTTAINTPNPPGGFVNPAVAGNPYYSLQFTQSGSSVTATSYFWQTGTNPANTWQVGSVNFSTTQGTTNNLTNTLNSGKGIGATGPQNTTRTTDYVGREFVVLDFGATAQLDTLSLWLVDVTTPKYFTYAWLSSPPTTGISPAIPNPVATAGVLQSPFQYWDTSVPGYNDPTPDAFLSGYGTYNFNFSSHGSGRYLMVGTSDMENLGSVFRIQSVTYTNVPDGASTLALLGVAIGALGFATRRRQL